MSFLSRVVWSEGMYIGPHHFQAQSRYFEDSIRFATSGLSAYAYGILGSAMDREALQNGTIALLHARGVLPDGLLFKMPESDPLPDPRSIGNAFPSDRDQLLVYLAIQSYVPDGANCAPAGVNGSPARFVAQPRAVADEWTGRSEKEVRVGRKNILLALETELQSGSIALPIARIIRSGSARFEYDEAFVPPILQLTGSERLIEQTGQLIQALEEKSRSLTRRGENPGKTGYSTREIANFWFLHAINSALAPLGHLWRSKHGHPEELYLELARLAGALCTFTLEVDPGSIPPYNHADPGACFREMGLLIRRLLEIMLPTNVIPIELVRAGDWMSRGDVKDQRCLGSSSWVFGIRAKMTIAELITKTPELIKICSEQFVPELVKRALPGMTLNHLANPPSAVSTSAETQYFSLNRVGPCWDHVKESRRIGVYVPAEFVEPEFELLVVLNS